MKKRTNKRTNKKQPTSSNTFKGSIVGPYGSIKEYTSEEAYNRDMEVYKFREQGSILLQKFIETFQGAYCYWRLNSNTLHFVYRNYTEVDPDKAIEDYIIFDRTTLKPAILPFKKYLNKWEFYKTTLSNIIDHEYRHNKDRESTKGKEWESYAVDFQFKSAKVTEEFVKICIKFGLDVRGYSQLKMLPDDYSQEFY